MLALLALPFLIAPPAHAAPPIDQMPRWVVEARAGRFEPTLEDYARFFGDDYRRHAAVAFGYRFLPWLEAGAELAHSRDRGLAEAETGELTGRVEYTLLPAQVFLNVRWERSPRPLLVPYAGAGLVRAFYRQRVELDDTRRGRTDLGTTLRAGLQLSLDRLDPQPDSARGPLQRTFLFIEAQRIVTEVDGTDLGGDLYLLGLRFEFGRARGR